MRQSAAARLPCTSLAYSTPRLLLLLVLVLVTCVLMSPTLVGSQTTDGLECYKCSSSKDLSLCLSRTETCSSSQTCFKEETTGASPGVIEKYSMGCMDTTACARLPQSTARDLCDNAGQSCYSCCRDKSLCNFATASLGGGSARIAPLAAVFAWLLARSLALI